MSFNKAFAVLAGIVGLANAAHYASSVHKPDKPYHQVQVHTIKYPVIVNVMVHSNTIIHINGGVTINVNNAPTHLVTTIHVTSTVRATV
jgi:hypothetical protein